MARVVRKSSLKEVLLSAAKHDPSHVLREVGKQEIVIAHHGKLAGVSIGFESDPRFLRGIEKARASMRMRRGVRLEDIDGE